MPIGYEKAKKRFRFFFNRIVEHEGRRQRVRASLLLPAGWSRAQADAYDRKRSAELYALASGVERPRYLITEAVRLYIEERLVELRMRHKCTLELANLLPWYEGREVTDLQRIAADYRRAHAHLAPATVRNRLAYLRSACRYAVKSRQWPVPLPEAALPVVRNQRQVYLRSEQQKALFNAFEDDLARAMFTLSYAVGARWRSELLPRKATDVVREGRDVYIDCGLTKSGRRVWKWVPPWARWTLKYIPWPYSEFYFRHRWLKALAASGLPYMRPHDQRHSLASEILAAGGTLPDVTAALGHTSLLAAARYSHLYPEHVKQVLGKLAKGRKR